ncbi:4-hydroxy-tetrahydrodipicolinate synthase [Arthrobacter roseus]|uniref:4-hydroxy-tetrahydrodipicolinate synthase n=1 Tax=Arthrobacter roseus TaxID=136274 RepID=UPI001963DA47|nr:4-hydroxy-tetrahydrodipicolinate synthase [Arthrobacter roseus]MBM7848973.1 4-hydroxy-tetrahydrodipicolinate synthase [Arthrobacter roseus]
MKFRSDPRSLSGALAALFTPFTAEGDVDNVSLRNMINWQIANGSTGITLGGSTGEPSSLSVAERIDSIKVAAVEINDRVPFMPGTGTAKMSETLELTQAAIDAGADASMIITPYYSRPTQEALYRWYAEVAQTFPDMPFVIYNVPSRTAVDMAPETVARLFRDFENIVGIKETTKDFEHFSRVMHACGRDLLVWSGIELLCLPLMALGGVGFISALANLAPRAISDMYHAWEEGDLEKARDIHYGLHPLADLLFVETNPAPSKWVMARRGLISSDHVRSPLITPTDAGITKIEELLAQGEDFLTPITGFEIGAQS